MNGLTRRKFLQLSSAAAGIGLLAACAPAPTAGPGTVMEEPTPVPTPAPEVAAGDMDPGMMRPPGNPTRGGTLRTAFGVTMNSFDAHQGGGTHVLGHMYNGLVRNSWSTACAP